MIETIQEHLDLLNAEIVLAKSYAEKYIEYNLKHDNNSETFYNMAMESLNHALVIHNIIHEELPAEYLPQWKSANEKFITKTEIIKAILE